MKYNVNKGNSSYASEMSVFYITVFFFNNFEILKQVNRIQEGLKRIQGSVLGTLLDFLSKELRRLLDERKAHALCLLQERERQKREAAEAGRRQIELRRRKEHDEMFKQVLIKKKKKT